MESSVITNVHFAICNKNGCQWTGTDNT